MFFNVLSWSKLGGTTAIMSAVAVIGSCGTPPWDSGVSCHPLKEVREDTAGVISRHEAERLAEESQWKGPSTNYVEIRNVRVSCLSTRGSFENDANPGGGRANPERVPPTMLVWVVEFNSTSWDSDEEWESFLVIVLRASDGEPLSALFGRESTLGD